MTLTVDQGLHVASGAVLALLAAAMLALRGRHRPALLFGVLLLGWAADSVLTLLGALTEPAAPGATPLGATVTTMNRLLTGAAWWSFLVVFPSKLRRAEVLSFAAIAAVAVLLALIGSLSGGMIRPAWSEGDLAARLAIAAETFGRVAMDSAAMASLPAFGLRAWWLVPADASRARSLALVGIGSALWLSGNSRAVARAGRGLLSIEWMLITIVVFVGATVLWAFAARGAHARLCRNVALLYAGMFTLLTLAGRVDALPLWAGGRVLGALVLAYAVLRGEIEGLDIKVRFALSKSTVAAAFVAAFFIASEGAQILFGQGNEWVGLAAAGALVFALAPLQRAAERLAERAVPVASPAAGASPAGGRGAESYRRAVRLALRDRHLSHDDEIELATVAHDLGLTAPDATRIRLEVERETKEAR